ncbi:MAG: hypothetical protein E7459_10780, partial [Ruminococcaceae bacterium]|nr:hypothetical protein [Oscillospiraceae bacterium]
MKQTTKRILSLLLVLAFVAGFVVPVNATEQTATDSNVTFTQVDNSAVSATLSPEVAEKQEQTPDYADTDMVRVSIVLAERSTVAMGYSVEGIATSSQAMAYRQSLREKQSAITSTIEKTTGEKLDVVWNLTLAANIISANVEYGQIDAIAAVPGVAEVLLENQYQPDVVKQEETVDPNMATSPVQIGSAAAWSAGYTGLGSRIAVIDTGTDTDHQSFSAAAFQYSLNYNAGRAGMSYEEYIESLDLLDLHEIAALTGELNAEINPNQAYLNQKLPFGYNYIDGDHDITHDNDSQGSHGSHVAGIAAANAWIRQEDGSFAPALESVLLQGVAPDAQIITMKVFGKNGGAYESDYMAAIEDAIVLGADSINLSLGSGSAGESYNAYTAYQEILDNLEKTGVVLAASAGNNSYWAKYAFNLGYSYAADVNMDTVGSPGSYTNSLAVASVDNDGYTSQYIQVGNHIIYYTERLYGNQHPMTYVAGEMPYVFIDGVGKPEDWDALDISLVGRIAICSRGENSFMDKITAALSRGAKAVIVYNNQPGAFGMDLTGNAYTWPSVSITQDDAALIRNQSQAVTNDAGEVLYYTGTMTVSRNPVATQYNNKYYTMSEFSSWGVPGSLELKPEITAPGGNIFSVNGVDQSGTGYEVMSGTSMASPQVAGMAAVLAQYIRETGLEEKTGLSARKLAQSLLMSTARPLVEETSGSYYSVFQQGAGLANVAEAVSAGSYILMDKTMNAGADDGKVKVELGDDPNREGVYDITFTIYNMSDREQAFKLSADFFTQNYFQYHNVNMGTILEGMYNYMDTATTPMPVLTTWTVDGKTMEPAGNVDGLDFNSDGLVNAMDGQKLLDYVVGMTTELTNLDKADVDDDGDVDSHDTYCFFKELGISSAVVPAGGSVEVTVQVELTEQWDAMIETWGTKGLYVEGYIHAETLTDAEGLLGTAHSIPVLGWYGNWSDPDMYDVDQITFNITKEDTQCPYVGWPTYYTLAYGNGNRANSYLTGNPTGLDTKYLPERNAINSENGTMIKKFGTNLIRNAAAMKFTATNDTTGEVLATRQYGSMLATYYVPSTGGWNIGLYEPEIYFRPVGVSEGDVITLDMAMAVDYYVNEDGTVDWDALGQGSHYTVSVTVDNTAPELKGVKQDLLNNTLLIEAWDNRYVAAVAMYNGMGTENLAKTGSLKDIAPNETGEFVLPLEGISGNQFLLQVVDYANNATTYVLNLELGEPEPLPQMMAFSNNNENWLGFDKTATASQMETILTPGINFYAATIANHMVIAVDNNGNLYVLDEANLAMGVSVANLGCIVTDLAYNKADGKVYGVTQTNDLIAVDYMTAEVVNLGKIGITTNTLACDNGTFYCNNLGGKAVYRFTLDTMSEPELVVTTNVGNTSEIQSMEIDPTDGTLYWLSHYSAKGFGFFARTSYYAYLYEIDTDAGTYTRRNNLNGSSLLQSSNERFRCLIIPENNGGRIQWPEGTDEIHSIRFPSDAVTIIKSREGKNPMAISVLPWNAVAPQLTWTSSDETVATVDANGNVTGLKEGTAVITATLTSDSSVSATCTVTVTALDVTMKGVVKTENQNSRFFSWNLKTDDTWTAGNTIPVDVMSATKSDKEDVYYMMDTTYNNWTVYKVSPTGEILESDHVAGNRVPLHDLQYSTYLSKGRGNLVMGILHDQLVLPQNPMNMDINVSMSTGHPMVALATNGHKSAELKDGMTGEVMSTIHYEEPVLLDSNGTVYTIMLLAPDLRLGGFEEYPSDLSLVFPGLKNMNEMGCSMVVGSDGALYLSAFTGNSSELYRLVLDEEAEFYHAQYIGSMGEGTYPVMLTEVTANSPEASIDSKPETIEIKDASAPETRVNVVTELKADHLVPASDAETAPTEDTVTITVTADEAANNGVTTVKYDADLLALTDIELTGDYTAKVTGEGVVTFGFVSMNGVAKDSTIATLTFDVLKVEDSVITVEHKQIGNAAGSTETIPVEFEHENTEIRGKVEPSCTTTGYTGDTYCVDCGRLIQKGQMIPATGHNFGSWQVTHPADCDVPGEETRYCDDCGVRETRVIPATGHSFGEWTLTKAPTCTEKGIESRSCVCGETETREVPATGHSFGEWKVTKEATCTENGEETRTCACGETETRVIPAHGHDALSVVVAPTCD